MARSANKYDPQTANRRGEADRRLRAIARRLAEHLRKTHNWIEEMRKQGKWVVLE